LQGLKAEIESPINVIYKEVVVGPYQADLLVEDLVIVELKVAISQRNYRLRLGEDASTFSVVLLRRLSVKF
jgi:GxxExxY protein